PRNQAEKRPNVHLGLGAGYPLVRLAVHVALAAWLLAGCSDSDSPTGTMPAPAACGTDLDHVPAPPPYKTAPPNLPGLWVLDLSGESTSRQLLARTLQGVVNRAGARLYIIDDVDDPSSSAESLEATRHWLTEYQTVQGLQASGGGRLEDALQVF